MNTSHSKSIHYPKIPSKWAHLEVNDPRSLLKQKQKYKDVEPRVKTTRPQRELEFLMLAHPNPKKQKLKFDGEKLVEVRETDLLGESKKNKAKAR